MAQDAESLATNLQDSILVASVENARSDPFLPDELRLRLPFGCTLGFSGKSTQSDQELLTDIRDDHRWEAEISPGNCLILALYPGSGVRDDFPELIDLGSMTGGHVVIDLNSVEKDSVDVYLKEAKRWVSLQRQRLEHATHIFHATTPDERSDRHPYLISVDRGDCRVGMELKGVIEEQIAIDLFKHARPEETARDCAKRVYETYKNVISGRLVAGLKCVTKDAAQRYGSASCTAIISQHATWCARKNFRGFDCETITYTFDNRRIKLERDDNRFFRTKEKYYMPGASASVSATGLGISHAHTGGWSVTHPTEEVTRLGMLSHGESCGFELTLVPIVRQWKNRSANILADAEYGCYNTSHSSHIAAGRIRCNVRIEGVALNLLGGVRAISAGKLRTPVGSRYLLTKNSDEHQDVKRAHWSEAAEVEAYTVSGLSDSALLQLQVQVGSTVSHDDPGER